MTGSREGHTIGTDGHWEMTKAQNDGQWGMPDDG